MMSARASIRVTGARQHNLQNIDVAIPHAALTVVTGPSGSGKSSLAFDTLYAEGQRRYVESLSAYARQFLEQMPKPDVDRIEGLPPTIAIEQRLGTPGPRSTVATSTEIHDYLRVLFARAGTPECWICGHPIRRQSTAEIVDAVLAWPEGTRIMVLAPMVHRQRGNHAELLDHLLHEGFVRARIDGEVRLLEEVEGLAPGRAHSIDVVVDRLVVRPGGRDRLADSLETATRLSGGRVIVACREGENDWRDAPFSTALVCPRHPEATIGELSPQLFSFNAPQGACETCNGLGVTLELDPDLIVPDPNRSLEAGAIAPWCGQGRKIKAPYRRMLETFCETFDVRPDIPFRNIPDPLRRILLHGTTEEDVKAYGASFEGVIPNLTRQWTRAESDSVRTRLQTYRSETPCTACGGTRLRPQALCVRFAGRNIAELCAMTITEAARFLETVEVDPEREEIARPLIMEVRRRLEYLTDVGVGYLTLDRSSATLSGGEWQRIRLATQIGSSLAGVCYVLDEPTIGLHPRDTHRLLGILKTLTEQENTVVVVEHDEEIIRAADHVIDLGPGAGAHGGQLLVEGTVDDLLHCERSVTGRYLSGKATVAVPQKRRPFRKREVLELRGVAAHNLKGIDVRIPIGRLVCITGVSGSGKSTLVSDVLLRALRRLIDRSGPRPGAYDRLVGAQYVDKVIEIDQTPIGRTPRSNPATYVGVFDLIRKLYARTREAKIRGYGPARFSFNVKGGRCEACEGQGTRRISMHFLPDVFVTCGTCQGKRYNRETLQIRYRGRTIADILAMRIEEAVQFFEPFAHIRQRLQPLKEVGLGYMSLGQPSNTLSGGEAQRVKLAAELHRSADERTLYILDEPTTGLHFADVRNLVALLHRLVDRGATVVVVEHHLDVIKSADWVIDLGPEGGEEGGRIVVAGTPEEVAACPDSHTGRFLRPRLRGREPAGQRSLAD